MIGSRVPDDRRVSIVTPCYNRAAYLDVLLRSLAWSSTSRDAFEVIVVNDGGVDHVGMVVEAWRGRGVDVRLVQLREIGAPRNNARARNAGWRAAKHPLILQTDPDIVWVSDVLSQMRAAWRPGLFCSVGRYLPLTREATLALAFSDARPEAAAFREAARGRPNQVVAPDGVGGLHGAFLIARADLERVGGYDESFEHWGWEDRELLVTLASDAGLHRERLADAEVVHLWHPTLRASTQRAELAAEGELSRVAFEVQLQRVFAEIPRSQRPWRRTSSVTSPRFTPASYAAWTPPSPELAAVFFDAHRLEAAQLRAEGHPSLARDVLRYALRQPWRSTPVASDWRESLRPTTDTVETLVEAARQSARGAPALEELVLCAHDLDDEVGRAVGLDALRRLAPEHARVLAMRLALQDGDLGRARSECGADGAVAGGPLGAALAIEIALLAGRWAEASAVLAACAGEPESHDYFERLRLAAYAALIAGASRLETARADDGADDDRTEFLFSSGMRSLRSGLAIGACLLFGRYLRDAAAPDERLIAASRVHLATAREHIARLASPDADILTHLPQV